MTSRELSASLEDYLEAIFWIVTRKGAARTKDITRRLGVKAASVTGALQSLAEKKLINYAPYEVITLTSEGLAAAREIIRKHEILKDFFVEVLKVDEKIADEGACKMEHHIPEEILEKMADMLKQEKKEPGMEAVENGVSLADMKPKQKGIVRKILRRSAAARRLAEMGVAAGALVEVERVAPLGDPIDIKVKGYHLSLRKQEAADIILSVE